METISFRSPSFVLKCTDKNIEIDKRTLGTFNYFNALFELDPECKEIEIKDESKDVLPIISSLYDGGEEYRSTEEQKKMLYFYMFKWDFICPHFDIQTNIEYLPLDTKDSKLYFLPSIENYLKKTYISSHGFDIIKKAYPDLVKDYVHIYCTDGDVYFTHEKIRDFRDINESKCDDTIEDVIKIFNRIIQRKYTFDVYAKCIKYMYLWKSSIGKGQEDIHLARLYLHDQEITEEEFDYVTIN